MSETYYVTREQLDLIEYARRRKIWTLNELINNSYKYKPLNNCLELETENALLRYLGGDETIEFKVKEQLYRLWRIDDDGDKMYMRINYLGTPGYSDDKDEAFTAPLEEIKKWTNPAWGIEEAN